MRDIDALVKATFIADMAMKQADDRAKLEQLQRAKELMDGTSKPRHVRADLLKARKPPKMPSRAERKAAARSLGIDWRTGARSMMGANGQMVRIVDSRDA